MEFFPFPLYLSYVNREGKSLKNIGKKILYCKDSLDFVAVSLIKHTFHISQEEIELRNW